MNSDVKRFDEAVSPVVGVMLLLVVTIIIAGVVSAFAGSLSETDGKGQQATFTAIYSQSRGLSIEHLGGDVLTTREIEIVLRPSTNMGSSMEMYASHLNKSIIMEKATGILWKDEVGRYQLEKFGPGDVAYVNATYATTEYLQPEVWAYSPAREESIPGYQGFDYGVGNSEYIGCTFYLEVYDARERLIGSVEVPVTA
jgi:flagellin-like protein